MGKMESRGSGAEALNKKELALMAPIVAALEKKRLATIASVSAKLAEVWSDFEVAESVLEALSTGAGYTCPLGPFRGARPPLLSAVETGTTMVDLPEINRAAVEIVEALEYTAKRFEALNRSLRDRSPSCAPMPSTT